jgi:hypothetical protein
MFKYFRQKYKRCLDPHDDMKSCFPIEHFSYFSVVQAEKRDLVHHYKYWVAKNRSGFKLLFDSIHLMDEVNEGETNEIMIQNSTARQELIMKQAWSKAWGDLSTDQQGKILHMRFGIFLQVPYSLHTEAMFDKLLKKHTQTGSVSTPTQTSISNKVDKTVTNDGHGEDKRHKPKRNPGFVEVKS